MTSFVLKIVAMVTMFCDHFGDAYVGHFSAFNLIGRIAFPIFAFQISEGFTHTRNLKKYFFRIGVFALISQVPFALFYHKFFNTTEIPLNIFFTLFLGLLAIYLYNFTIQQFAKKAKKIKFPIDKILGLVFVFLLSYIAEILNTDYGYWGVILIFAFYVLKQHKTIMTITFILLCTIKYGNQLLQTNFHFVYILLTIFTALPIILINMYTGKQGPKAKYFLYVFYPAHLLLLYLFL